MKQDSTSWEKAGKWYNNIVGEKGHYYHQHLIIPGVLKLFKIMPTSNVLDIGCGQGVFARSIPQQTTYVGIDLSASLIASAKNQDKNPNHSFFVADATKPLPTQKVPFSHAVAILSLQNMQHPQEAIKTVSKALATGGMFVIVLNHPAFRIPRQSGWGVDNNNLQYRFENRYLSPLKIPITMHPGEKNSETTWSFHYPLSFYIQALAANGFVITGLEEWASDKISVGKAHKMENRARSEFPLFLTIVARKI